MLFMGEEWGASTPFPYFCDFQGELADAVRAGRLGQFASPEQKHDPAFLATVPDPLAIRTFLSAKLNWNECPMGLHDEWLTWYKRILRVRKEAVVPLLRDLHAIRGEYSVLGSRQLTVRWKCGQCELRLDANLAGSSDSSFPPRVGVDLWLQGTELGEPELGPWTTRWMLKQ